MNNKSKKLNNKRYKKSKKNIDIKKGGFFFSNKRIDKDTFINSSISNLYQFYQTLLIELLSNSKFKLLSDTSLYGLIFLGEIQNPQYYFTDSKGNEIRKYIIKGSFISNEPRYITVDKIQNKETVTLKEFEDEIKIQEDIYLKSLKRYYEPIVPDIQLMPTSIKLDKLDGNKDKQIFDIDRISLQHFINNIIYKDEDEKDKINKYFEKIDNTNITFHIFIMKYLENYYTFHEVMELIKQKIFQDYNTENKEGFERKKYNDYTDYVDSLIKKNKDYKKKYSDIQYIEQLQNKLKNELQNIRNNTNMTKNEYNETLSILKYSQRDISLLKQELNRLKLTEEENKKLELLQKPKYIYSLYHIMLGLLGYIHGDAHGGNIMIYYDKGSPKESLGKLKAYIIDFGRITYDENLDYDIIQNPNPQIEQNKINNVIENIKQKGPGFLKIYRMIDKFDIKKLIKIINQKLININFEKNKIEIYKQLSNYNISKSKRRDNVIESDNIQNNQESYNHEVSKPKTKKKSIFNRFRMF